MIGPHARRLAASLFVIVATAIAGCAALMREQAADTEKLLVAAGFHRDDGVDFVAMAPREIVAQRHGAATSYTYADPQGCHCVYVGDGQAYARYRELAVSEAIARRLSFGKPNGASTNGPAWGYLDPAWAPTDAWDDPNPAITNF